MNQTPNYQFNQWDAEDRVLRTDFNADNAKIDAALKAEADARVAADSALNTALAKKGNCKAALTTYTGNGQYGQSSPTTIYFSGKPLGCFIACGGRGFAFLSYGCQAAAGGVVGISGNDLFMTQMNVSWSGSRVSFWENDARRQFNESGKTYYVLSLYAMDS